ERGQASNLMAVPTDCNQRDERRGWLGDAALTAGEAVRNFDLDEFYRNFLRDIRDAQLTDGDGTFPLAGAVPDTVPHTFGAYPADPVSDRRPRRRGPGPLTRAGDAAQAWG